MVKLWVNGRSVQVKAAPETPLLWVLREELGLTGTKFGCGEAQCGACTVQVDGEAVKSCVTSVSEVAGKRVLTIEGLGRGKLHPVQQAWIDEDVVQCGYCQPGHIMTASALLSRTPRPTDADIDRAMSGLICRCGTYQRVRKAIHRAAALLEKGGAK